MAIGPVTSFNGLLKLITDASNRDWNDASAGNIMFCLATSAYTPSATHSTTADIASGLITSGDGAPIAATALVIDDTATPGTSSYSSADASFGSNLSITAKYFIAVMPVTAGTFSATTSKLLFYVDLNTSGGSSQGSSVNSEFVVYKPAAGWFNIS